MAGVSDDQKPRGVDCGPAFKEALVRTSRLVAFIIGLGGATLLFGRAESRHPVGIHLEYFRGFTYSRQSFVWHLDEVFEARIALDSDGSYRLEMSVIDLGDGFPPEPGCLEQPLEPVTYDACAKPVKLTERALTEGEVARLMGAFAGLEILTEEDRICQAVGVSARIDQFRWESVPGADGPIAVTDFFCAPPYIGADRAMEIVDLLEKLRDGSRDYNGNGVVDAIDLEGGASKDEDQNGVPDECQPTFQRGDSNGDRSIDISDPVNTLDYLFRGVGDIPCLDAADLNDDGALDISDPIATLTLLFSAVAIPPGCGIDLTKDELGCLTSRPCP